MQSPQEAASLICLQTATLRASSTILTLGNEPHYGNPLMAEKSTVRVIPSAEISEGWVTIRTPSSSAICSKKEKTSLAVHGNERTVRRVLSAACLPGKLSGGFRQLRPGLTGNYHRFLDHWSSQCATPAVVLLWNTISFTYDYGW
jgi:hypothetical protein